MQEENKLCFSLAFIRIHLCCTYDSFTESFPSVCFVLESSRSFPDQVINSEAKITFLVLDRNKDGLRPTQLVSAFNYTVSSNGTFMIKY